MFSHVLPWLLIRARFGQVESDGALSIAEWPISLSPLAKLEVNKDGSVEVKEFLSWLLLPDDPGEAEVRILKRLSVARAELGCARGGVS